MTVIVMQSMSYPTIRSRLRKMLVDAPIFDRGEWQSQSIAERPEMQTHEVCDVTLEYHVPDSLSELQDAVQPNLPWAEDHFRERVGGEPLNPPPSEAWWPFAQRGNGDHKKGQIFSHTYPERMWPKRAGWDTQEAVIPHFGIRFAYGDLEDVIKLLRKNPRTRQAYLPIWFPEDTGAVHGERVPCTLGYHFLVRGDELNITYYIRSCDFMRHMNDDVYMACRLLHWVVAWVNETTSHDLGVGTLIMHIANLHIFDGDIPKLKEEMKQEAVAESSRLMRLL